MTVRELADDRRDPCQTGQPGSSNASFTGDELIALDRLGDEDRLDDAVFGDARRKRVKLRPVDRATRLVRVADDPVKRDFGRRVDTGCPAGG